MAVFREGLPLTMKSCFYPLIGDKIFGWPGDLVTPPQPPHTLLSTG